LKLLRGNFYFIAQIPCFFGKRSLIWRGTNFYDVVVHIGDGQGVIQCEEIARILLWFEFY